MSTLRKHRLRIHFILQVQADKDHDILDEEDIPKPEKPKPFNDAELRTKILDKYQEICRKPGLC